MNELAAFCVGVVVGGVLAVLAMAALLYWLNKAIDNDKDLGRGNDKF